MKTEVKVLSEEDIKQIHETTMKVMMNPGLRVDNNDARAVLREAGCIVDDETRVVKFPREVVEKAIASAPDHFNMYGRTGKAVEMRSDGSLTNFLTFGVGTEVTDYLGNGEYRDRASTMKDLGEICKVADALDNIDWVCAPVSAMDMAVETEKCRALREWKTIFSNLTKPLMADPDPRFIEEYFEMEVAMYNGDRERALREPVSIMGSCPSSPLQLDDGFGEFALKAPKYGFPMMILSMAMGAASAPINIAGTIVVHNAEVLAGITLVQCKYPGAPCFYGSSTTAFDFGSGSAPVGSPELSLISSCVAQMGRYYQIPTVVAGT
ncbi:MAG: hypothetical protein E7Z63_05420 [Thermoplasmata archaeon]|nr:hypothetical protein [Thermoplasmata archaeon]